MKPVPVTLKKKKHLGGQSPQRMVETTTLQKKSIKDKGQQMNANEKELM